jgi:hypothetical protein
MAQDKIRGERMTTYVAEIEGRAVVAFGAENYAEAQDLITTEWLHDDLAVLESNGRPLWDGKSELHVREAVEEERVQWESSWATALSQGEATADEIDEWVVYLVPVSDPTDNEC